MKILKWSLLILVLLILIGIGILYASLDHIIKQTVETQGTAQLNVSTTLDAVALQLFKGTLDLSNLSIASPRGFTSTNLLSLGGLSVDTGGLLKLRDQPIHLTSIHIDQPTLVVEQSNGKLNIQQLMNGLPSATTPASAPDQSATPAAPQPAKEPTKFIIDDFVVDGAHVIIHPGIPGLPSEYDITLPTIELKNIGNTDNAQNGAAMQQVVVTLITQLTTKAAQSGKLPPEVSALLSGNFDEIKAKLITDAQTRLNKAAGKLEKNLSPAAAKSATDLLNQGFGILKQATSKPANP